jgi:hypothetical protein
MDRITTTIKCEWLRQTVAGTKRTEYRELKPYLGGAASFQETRDVRKRVLRRPHYGRLAVRVLR